jgi:hypothetical protein
MLTHDHTKLMKMCTTTNYKHFQRPTLSQLFTGYLTTLFQLLISQHKMRWNHKWWARAFTGFQNSATEVFVLLEYDPVTTRSVDQHSKTMWWPHFQGTSEPYRWGHYTVSEYDPVMECRIPEQTSQMADFEGATSCLCVLSRIHLDRLNNKMSWLIKCPTK